MSHSVSVIALLFGGCAARKPAVNVATPPAVQAAACLQPTPLTGSVDKDPPSSAEAIAPGRYLYVERTSFEASADPFHDDVAEVWVGVEDAAGGHRFWPVAQVAFDVDDVGRAEVVASADLTGDGIDEHLIEIVSRTRQQSGMLVAVEERLTASRVLWDPAGAQILASVETAWGSFQIAPPACDDWCIDGIATTEAEEADFDCTTCDDAADEGRRSVRLDGQDLVIGDPERVSGEHSLDTTCPPGRFRWAGSGFAWRR